METYRFFFTAGAVLAGLAVMAGAFGAHALEGTLSTETLETYSTAVRYQMYHALGLLGAGWVMKEWRTNVAGVSGWLFLAGILLFSGSLYLLSLTGIGWLGAITPFGGLAFIIGWFLLPFAVK